MLLAVSVSVALVLLIVLFHKFIGVDRGLDNHKESVNAVVIGKEPYVPPAVDKRITEEMKTLQQMMIPVQYIDNGLMPKIENGITNDDIELALKQKKMAGPTPYLKTDFSKATWQQAKFNDSLQNFEPSIIVPKAEISVEPFNSFLGMVVSEGQIISPVDP